MARTKSKKYISSSKRARRSVKKIVRRAKSGKVSGRRLSVRRSSVRANDNPTFFIHEKLSLAIVCLVALISVFSMWRLTRATVNLDDLLQPFPYQWYASSSAGFSVKFPLDWRADQYFIEANNSLYETVVATREGERGAIYTGPADGKPFVSALGETRDINGLTAYSFVDNSLDPKQAVERVIIPRPDGRVTELVGAGPG